jgi:hypothetical protein
VLGWAAWVVVFIGVFIVASVVLDLLGKDPDAELERGWIEWLATGIAFTAAGTCWAGVLGSLLGNIAPPRARWLLAGAAGWSTLWLVYLPLSSGVAWIAGEIAGNALAGLVIGAVAPQGRDRPRWWLPAAAAAFLVGGLSGSIVAGLTGTDEVVGSVVSIGTITGLFGLLAVTRWKERFVTSGRDRVG